MDSERDVATVGDRGEGTSPLRETRPGGVTAERITFRQVFRSSVRALADLDFASARTVVGLARAPGLTARRYIEGERSRFTNPVKLAFLTSTLYVLMNGLTTTSGVMAMFDPLVALQGVWPYAMLVLLLPAAVVQRMLFRKRRYNVAECYAFGLFVLGAVALAGAVVLTVVRVASIALPPWPALLIAAVYWSWSVTGLYGDRRPSVWLRGLVVYAATLGALAGALYAVQAYRFSGLGG